MAKTNAMGLTDITALTSRIQELEKENSRLRAILNKNGISYTSKDDSLKENVAPAPIVTYSLEEKVAIFQGLFQGRSDVFAKRWYSETSKKSGYQPVCEREWNPDFCDKRKYKCADCPNRQFAPLSYSHLFNHFAGKDKWGRDVIGLYPIRER